MRRRPSVLARAPSSVYELVDLASALGATDPARAKKLFAKAAEQELPLIPGTAFPPEDLLESAYVASTGMAQLAESSGDLDAAEASFGAAEALAELGRQAKKTLPFKGNWDSYRVFALQHLAARTLERAKSLSGTAQADALDEAQRALNACDRCEPDSSETIRLRSILLQRRGDPLGRKRLIEEAFIKRPKDSLLRILWANELRQVGRTGEALTMELDVATTIFDSFDKQKSLSIAKEALGSKVAETREAGRALLERLAALGVSSPETLAIVKEARELLQASANPAPNH